MIGTTEIIIILAIALLVFGPQKLPEIGRQIGSAMRELRKMSGDVQRALNLDEHLGGYDSTPSYGARVYDTRYQDAAALPAYNNDNNVDGTPLDQYGLDDDSSPGAKNKETAYAAVTTAEPPGPPLRQQG